MDELLSGLRDRLQELCRVPPMPDDWTCVSAMVAAQGFCYGGDFFVAGLVDLPGGPGLQMVLVDVCGKGETALPDAVQFAGALEALLGVIPADEMLLAANDYLLRQPNPEAIATAVQVVIEFGSGRYLIRSAGHPPVLRYDATVDECLVDNARGTALGAVIDPEFHVSEGTLLPGEGLLFYTDGVVESRSQDIEVGISWLCRTAKAATRDGLDDAPATILAQVEQGDDDRAVLILGRRGIAAPGEALAG